ncbi:MAG: SDR family NAD(P)-dependent oxidoreductase, partial [Myxococcota bacterium]
ARKPPTIPFLSNVSGTWITAEQATDPNYWAEHIRAPVRYLDCLSEILSDPNAALIEVGPGRSQRTMVRWHPAKAASHVTVSSLPAAKSTTSAVQSLLSAAGHLWIAGVELAPAPFHAHGPRRRLPLPTYPFERRRYWVERRPLYRTSTSGQRSLDKSDDISQWGYVPTWQEQPLAADRQSYRGPWLVLIPSSAPQHDLPAAVIRALRTDDTKVILVEPGPAYRKLDTHYYQIRLGQPEDYEALLVDIGSSNLPTRLVHMCALRDSDATERDRDTEQTQIGDESFYSLLYLARALGQLESDDRTFKIWTMCPPAHSVTGNEALATLRALALGPCRVIPREYRKIHCYLIDSELPPAASWQQTRLLKHLVAELSSPGSEQMIAFRGGRRWQQSFHEVTLHGDTQDTAPAGPVRAGGVYLITGGLGGLGLEFADYLARSAEQPVIALLGRSELPPRAEWQTVAAAPDTDEALRLQLTKLLALDTSGAHIQVYRGDVSDPHRMRSVVTELLERHGAIHGVIHAAGVPDGGLIHSRTRADIDAVLTPKVRGTQVLAEVLAGQELDFLALFSSLSTVVGRIGQVAYTAANAFLDAFASDYYERNGVYTVAINWGAWEQVGMAALPPAPDLQPTNARSVGHLLADRCLIDEPDQLVFETDFRVDS